MLIAVLGLVLVALEEHTGTIRELAGQAGVASFIRNS